MNDCLREELIDQCKVGDLFKGLISHHSREQYYKAHFNDTVSYQDSFTYSMYVLMQSICKPYLHVSFLH